MGYIDSLFSITGFSNWQKAISKFNKHAQSANHRHAVDMAVMASKPSMDVGEKLSTALSEERAKSRNVLYAILSTIRFLARQGLPLRGRYQDDCVENSGEIDSNFIQTLKLRADEVPNLDIWMKRSQDCFTSPDIQNELLQMMALTVIRRIAATVAGIKFAVMVDETTDALL